MCVCVQEREGNNCTVTERKRWNDFFKKNF